MVYKVKMIRGNKLYKYEELYKSYANELKYILDFSTRIRVGNSEESICLLSLTTILQITITKKKPRDTTTMKPAASPKVTQRPRGDLIQLYSGNLTGPDTAETCFAK